MKRLFVLTAMITATLLPATEAQANFPVKCYTKMDYGVLFTKCSDGYYAQTVRQGRYKISTWRNQDIPQYVVACQGINDKSLLPVKRCARTGMYIHTNP